GALSFARAYETLVRSELETEPDQEVADFVALLRRGSGDLVVVSTTPSQSAAIPTPPRTDVPDRPTAQVRVASTPVAETDVSTVDISQLESWSSYTAEHTHEEPTTRPRGRVKWRVLFS